MFVHNCTACERRQLIFPSQVTSVSDSAQGIVYAFTCWCGATQTQATGQVATTAHRTAVAA